MPGFFRAMVSRKCGLIHLWRDAGLLLEYTREVRLIRETGSCADFGYRPSAAQKRHCAAHAFLLQERVWAEAGFADKST